MGVIDWSVMDGLDTEESWQFIKSNIINLMHENIPKQGDKGSENRQPRQLTGLVRKSVKKNMTYIKSIFSPIQVMSIDVILKLEMNAILK